MTDSHFEGSLIEKRVHHETGKESAKGDLCMGDRSQVTIDMLPDVALLVIFNAYVDTHVYFPWYTLVHVCRKWRHVVFASPLRLNLRLYCGSRTPVREMLDIWPRLPIVISLYLPKVWDEDNVFAALEHNDRICDLQFLGVPSLRLEKVLAAMQQPFPALTHLQLQPTFETHETAVAVQPDSFLGGSTPRLQALWLDCTPFPGLPKLLLSATHLVYLRLSKIPHSGYISPEAIATALPALTRLEELQIEFESPRCRPDRRSRLLPPLTRTLLPVLTVLWFKGVGEYLEVLVARVDAPLLDKLYITFFHQLIVDTLQLARFISRAPQYKAHDGARVAFSKTHVVFSALLGLVPLPWSIGEGVRLRISCRQPDWQLSSLAQACNSFFSQAPILTAERLYVVEDGDLHWQDDIESGQWLELFRPFTAVKDLYVSSEFTPRIAPALQELIGERVTEVLPALETLFLGEPLPSGPVREAIEQFVAARHLDNHPIAVSVWKIED